MHVYTLLYFSGGPIIYARKSETVMSSRKKVTVFVILGWFLILAACASQQAGVPITTDTPAVAASSESTEIPAAAVLAAQQWLATQLNVAAEQVQIIEAEQAEWTDSCLGLGGPDESCLQAITPGWRVVLEVSGQRYEVRTDRSGSTIRIASPEVPGLEIGLENTQWSLVSFGTPGAEQPLVEGSAITLMLAGGQTGGSGGCNGYGGTYQVEGNTITFGEITRTLRACADDRVTEQEERYFQALETANEYRIEGNQLQIIYDAGNGLMIFEPASSTGPGGPLPTLETPGG